MAVIKLFLCVAILAASLKDARAISKEELETMMQRMLPHILECSKEHGLEEGAFKEARESGKWDTIDSCFFACMFKKSELMTDDGKFDTAKALEKSKELLKDEEDLKNAEAAISDCESVNSEDGDECARAKLLAKCLAKHKGKFTVA